MLIVGIILLCSKHKDTLCAERRYFNVKPGGTYSTEFDVQVAVHRDKFL